MTPYISIPQILRPEALHPSSVTIETALPLRENFMMSLIKFSFPAGIPGMVSVRKRVPINPINTFDIPSKLETEVTLVREKAIVLRIRREDNRDVLEGFSIDFGILLFNDPYHPLRKEDILQGTSFVWDLITSCLPGPCHKSWMLPGISEYRGARLVWIEFQLYLNIRLENIQKISLRRGEGTITHGNDFIAIDSAYDRIRFEQWEDGVTPNGDNNPLRPLVRARLGFRDLESYLPVAGGFEEDNFIARYDLINHCHTMVKLFLTGSYVTIPREPGEKDFMKVARLIALEKSLGKPTADLVNKAIQFFRGRVSKAAINKGIKLCNAQVQYLALADVFEMESYVPRTSGRKRDFDWPIHPTIAAAAQPVVVSAEDKNCKTKTATHRA
jgi:hypothetical protein